MILSTVDIGSARALVERRSARAPQAPPHNCATQGAHGGSLQRPCQAPARTRAPQDEVGRACRPRPRAAAPIKGGGARAMRPPPRPRLRPRLQRAPASGVSNSSRSASDPVRPARAASATAETHGLHSPAAVATARARAPRALRRPFDRLRRAPISGFPKAPAMLATSRRLPAPPPPPCTRSAYSHQPPSRRPAPPRPARRMATLENLEKIRGIRPQRQARGARLD